MNDKYETASLVQIRENRHSTGLHEKRGLTIMHGKGGHLWDERGVQYIDCIAGQGSVNIGHANTDVAVAIAEQSQRLISCPKIFYNDKRAELLEKLSGLTPDFTTRFLLCNSESEATEAAFSFVRIATGRDRIVACTGSDHGFLPEDYDYQTKKLIRIPFNDITKLDTAITKETAAVILELVQSSSGVTVATTDYVAAVSKICSERKVLLIIDETQTGFGRTGRMFAFNHYGIQPDVITMANAIANGIPLGVVAITKAVGDKLPTLERASIFGGNPLACAAACATIDYISQFALADRAKELGDYFIGSLRSIESPKIVDVRGQGLMVGLELSVESADIVQLLSAQGILTMSAGHKVVRYMPPLIIAKEDLDTVVEKTAQVLS